MKQCLQQLFRAANWLGGVCSRHGGPFADVPALDNPARHVGIRLRELFSHFGRLALEQKNRAVDRICERSTKHEFAARAGLPRLGQVRFAEFPRRGT